MTLEGLEYKGLFVGMNQDEIQKCVSCSSAGVYSYKKEEMIFQTGDQPQYLYMVLSGAIAVCKDFASGKRIVVSQFEKRGELFGEVYLFLPDAQYELYAMAKKDSVVLRIPKSFFYHSCSETCSHHEKLIKNMLAILSSKAYFLNQKVQLMSSSSLRQKIARVLLGQAKDADEVKLSMNREEMADYLGVTRPSLSREMMKMKDEGLIGFKGKVIQLLDREELEMHL